MNKTNLIIVILIMTVIAYGSYQIYNKASSDSIGTPSVSPSPSPSSQADTQLDLLNTQAFKSQPQAQQPVANKSKQYKQFPGVLAPIEMQNKKAVIKTAKGNIEFEIYPEASKAASNFIFLAKDGFYDNLIFHRVEPGFVVQGGDPLGNGTGGPGYKFEDELVTKPYSKGVVAMANAGPNTNGSQFFIMLADNPSLPPQYTIFGKVIAGQEAVEKIVKGDVMQSVTIENLK